MQEVPITEAKNAFTALVHQVEGGEIVHLTRHGRPVAVLLSEAEYQDLRQYAATRGDLLDFVQGWRGGLPEDWRGMSPDELDGVLDRDPGKAYTWET
jgi:prevent-host-death family protein